MSELQQAVAAVEYAIQRAMQRLARDPPPLTRRERERQLRASGLSQKQAKAEVWRQLNEERK